MSQAGRSLIIGIIGATLLSGAPGFSQTPSPNSAAERRKALDEREAQQHMKLEMKSQKILEAVRARADRRDACVKQAKERGLSFYNRRRIMKQCTSS